MIRYICMVKGFNLIDHVDWKDRIFNIKFNSRYFWKILRFQSMLQDRKTYSMHISQARSSQGERCYCRPPLSFGISRWPRKSIVRSSILSSRSEFSSEFHEFREPEPEPLEGERRPLPEGSSLRETNIFFYNLVEDRGGEHLLVTVLHTVPLLLNPSVATSEARQSLRLLDDTFHDVAKRLRRRSHIRARFVWKFVPTCEQIFLFTDTPWNLFISFFYTGVSKCESETNCPRKYSRKMHEICVNARRILMADVHTQHIEAKKFPNFWNLLFLQIFVARRAIFFLFIPQNSYLNSFREQ